MEMRVEYFHSLKEYRGLSYIIGVHLRSGVKMTGETNVPVNLNAILECLRMLLHRLTTYGFWAVILTLLQSIYLLQLQQSTMNSCVADRELIQGINLGVKRNSA